MTVRRAGPKSIGPVPDGLSEDVRRFLESLRSATTAVLDGTVARQQVAAGIIAGGGAGGEAGSEETDLTPPPSPFDVVVAAGVDYVGVVTGNPTFTQGNGYDRTIVYGAKYPGTGPLPTFAAAVVVHEFRGEVGTFPTEPAQQWHIWVRWRSRDGVLSATVVGGVNGFQVTTGQITNAMVAEINASKIRAGQLGIGEYIQSSGFVPGSTAGFRIDGNGGVEFRNVGNTRVFNLGASGTAPVLRVAQTIGGPGLEILGNGSVSFQGGISASTITGGTITGSVIQTTNAGKRVTINEDLQNELRSYGDRGDGTIELLASIGIRPSGSDFVICELGAENSIRNALVCRSTNRETIDAICYGGTSRSAIQGTNASTNGNGIRGLGSNGGSGVLGQGFSGITHGVKGEANNGHGGHFSGNAIRSALFLTPVEAPPSTAQIGSLAMIDTNGAGAYRLCYADGTIWRRVADGIPV